MKRKTLHQCVLIVPRMLYVFLRLSGTTNKIENINQELIENVRQLIGPIASFRIVGAVNGLPKSRSGKIMRKIIAKLANSEQVKVLKRLHMFYYIKIQVSMKQDVRKDEGK